MRNSLILIALVVLSSNLRAACFQNNTVDSVGNLKVPSLVCIKSLKAELNVFDTSTAAISLSLDSAEVLKVTRNLKGKKIAAGYEVKFNLVSKEDSEGVCDRVSKYTISGTANVDASGKLLKLTALEGETSTSNDWCHDSPQYESFSFTAL
jgi:predicted small secreted protein